MVCRGVYETGRFSFGCGSFLFSFAYLPLRVLGNVLVGSCYGCQGNVLNPLSQEHRFFNKIHIFFRYIH